MNKRITLNTFFLLTIILFLSHNLNASHILGGTMSYKTINKTIESVKYQFSMKVYRDCYRGRPLTFFDDVVSIGIFGGDNKLVQTLNVPLHNSYTVGECVTGNVCVQEGEYKWEVSLPITDKSYFFVYQRCCRTFTVQNLFSPGTSGFSIVLELTKDAQKADKNHSPILKNLVPLGVCVGEPVNVDFETVDFEKDSIKYELVPSFTGAYAATPIPITPLWPVGNATYNSGFTPTSPLGNNITLKESSLKGITNEQGQFVITLAYSEYRNGVLLSKSYFDYTISTFNCGNASIDSLCLRKPVIRGNVFYDLNGDNIKNPDETAVPNALISSPNNWSDFTNEQGNYTVNVDTSKNYTFKIINLNPDNFGVTPIDRKLNTTNTPAQLYEAQDFAIKGVRSVDNLFVDLVIDNARPGFNSLSTLSYKNIGTTVLNGNFVFTLDPKQEFVKSTIQPFSQSDNVFIWKIDNLKPFEQKQIFVEVKTKTDAPLRSFVNSKVVSTITGNDIDTTDNSKTVMREVRGAYDPNDISVNKTNVLTKDKIQLNALDYLVRFQNTGNLFASKVEIIDTLIGKLNINTIEMLSSSHKYDMQIVDNINKTDDFTILKWTFDNINLPDSISNEKGSHGFVSFRIKNNPTKMALLTDSIFNRAAIYFDFNAPVVTNIAKTLYSPLVSITELTQLGLTVFPNPTSDILNIKTHNKDLNDIVIEIVNLSGQVLLQEKLKMVNPQINIQTLSEGLYFLKVRTPNGIGIVKIFKQ
jgi:Secretion system C-terminal sorting domain